MTKCTKNRLYFQGHHVPQSLLYPAKPSDNPKSERRQTSCETCGLAVVIQIELIRMRTEP